MKLRQPWLIRLVALLGSIVLRLWTGTMRFRLRLNGQHVDPKDPTVKQHYVYAFWHEAMIVPTGWKSRLPMFVLISQHADGELIARICMHVGVRVVRGSSTRGGMEASRELLRRAKQGHIGITPDGPRGPRRRLQPGIVFVASRTGLPIVPVGIGFSQCWRAQSWDRFAIPKPWSQAFCVAGKVTPVPPNLTKAELEQYRQLVEERLLEATALAEAWAETA